jgi:protein-S-isoprenylcysteine O-methyltransferase Ste14
VNAEHVERAMPIPAPVVFFGLLILGFLLNWALPLAFIPKLPAQIAGLIIAFLGFLIGVSGIIVMRSAHTSPNPRKPTTALVEKGVFRHTRNPLYVSMFVLFLGIAVFTNVLWLILLLPLLFVIVDRWAVKPEESYLERTFGDSYLQYKKRVPRWV